MQAADAASSEERATSLALATEHQLPSLAARLGALNGAEACKSACAAEGVGSNSGGPIVVLRANLSSSMHTELTRCGSSGAVLPGATTLMRTCSSGAHTSACSISTLAKTSSNNTASYAGSWVLLVVGQQGMGSAWQLRPILFRI